MKMERRENNLGMGDKSRKMPRVGNWGEVYPVCCPGVLWGFDMSFGMEL